MEAKNLNEAQNPALQQGVVSGSKSAVEILAENDVYVEHSLGGRYWCYKYQPKGERIIICSNEDKELVAKKMIDELGALGIYFR